MSRRRVSVKELGVVDCQGWLLRRKEGRSFLGTKWKRYWFVLKKSSLYWYADKMAEKAEGFIQLSGFTIEPAKQSRRKHAITASHPLVVTIFIAAESVSDMKKWIHKLSEAAEPRQLISHEECYSEGSDQEECASTSCSRDRGQEAAEPENADALQPLCEAPPPAGETRRRRTSSDGSERLSWPDGADGGASPPLIHVEEDELEKPADEMERLYNHLKAASVSPIGQSISRDFRASFIRRCRDDKVNEKLHLLRILGSTLKAKESELQAVDLILSHPALTPPTYRKWRLSNAILLQGMSRHQQAAGGAAELRPSEASTV